MKNTRARKDRILKENEFFDAVADQARAHAEAESVKRREPGEVPYPNTATIFLRNFSSRHPELAQLQNAVSQLNNVLMAGMKSFAPRRQLEEIRKEGIQKTENVYRDAVKKEMLFHIGKITEARTAYEKANTSNPERELLQNVRNQQSIQAMSQDELKLHAERFINGQGTYSPDYLNILSGELKKAAGPEDQTFGHLRVAMTEERVAEPWLELPGVDFSDDMIQLYTNSKIPEGSFAVPCPPNSGEGAYGLQNFKIDDAVIPLLPEGK